VETERVCVVNTNQDQRGSYAVFIKVNRKFPFPIFCELAKSPCKTRNGILNQLVACCCQLQTFISRLFRFFTSPLGNDEHIFLDLIFLPCSPATGSLQGDLTASVAYVILLGKKTRFRRILKRAEEFSGNICASVCNNSTPNLKIPRLVFLFVAFRLFEGPWTTLIEVSRSHSDAPHCVGSPLDKRLARCRDFYLITRKIHER
jgi:hypothetical protein